MARAIATINRSVLRVVAFIGFLLFPIGVLLLWLQRRWFAGFRRWRGEHPPKAFFEAHALDSQINGLWHAGNESFPPICVKSAV